MEFKNENFQFNSLKNLWDIEKWANFNRNWPIRNDRLKDEEYVRKNMLFEVGNMLILYANEPLPLVTYLMTKWRFA